MSFLGMNFGDPRVDMMTQGQSQALNNITSMFNQQFGQGAPVYQGQLTPGASPLQQHAFDQAPGYLQTPAGYQSALNQALTEPSDFDAARMMYQSQLGASRNEFNDMLRQIENRYGSGSSTGGALPWMASNAVARYGADQDALLGNLALQDTMNARQNRLGALGMAQSGMQTQANNLNTLAGLGLTQRGIQGQQLADPFMRWEAGQWYNNPAMNLMQPTLGSQRYALRQGGGGLGGLLGGFGTAATGLGSLFT